MTLKSDRRNFIKQMTTGAAGVAISGVATGMSARSYSRIIGANDRLGNELLVKAQKKYNKVVQMGNQHGYGTLLKYCLSYKSWFRY